MDLNDLPELDTLERIKCKKEIEQLEIPFWKKGSFYTIIFSAISITLTAILGYSAFIKTQDEQLETDRETFIKDMKAFEDRQLDFQSEEARVRNEILTYQIDTIQFQWLKAQFDYLSILQENQSIANNLGQLNQREFELRNRLSELTNSMSANLEEQNQLILEQKELDEINISLKAENDEILFERERQVFISSLYGLKSDLIKLITPSGKSFSGKFLNVISNVNIKKDISDQESIRLIDERLYELLKHQFISFKTIETPYDELRTHVNGLTKKRFKSNRYIHNSRILLGLINPKIDELIQAAEVVEL